MPVIPNKCSVFDPTGKLNNQMARNCVDLTHDCLAERYWRPIVREEEVKPPDNILRDKLLLKDWELMQVNNYYNYCWDRRIYD